MPFLNLPHELDTSRLTPWDTSRQSIFDAIAGAPEPVENLELPDDSIVQSGRDLRFVPGALDAVLGSRADRKTGASDTIFGLLKMVLAAPSVNTATALYSAMSTTAARGYVAKFCTELKTLPKAQLPTAVELFRWLARRAPDREVVKTAIAALGQLGTEADEDLLWTLGRHNEFTLLTADALTQVATDPEHSIWALSKELTGWGRINTVERLKHTQNKDIKHWLVRDGFRNTILNQYLVGIALVTGDLASQLNTRSPDKALLDGTADILAALVHGGPCRDISAYPDAIAVCELFIEHSMTGDIDLTRLYAIAWVLKFLTAQPSKRHPGPTHWSQKQIRAGIADGRKILMKPAHIVLVKDTLASGDQYAARQAHFVAKALGLNLWDLTFQRARKGGEIHWPILLDDCDAQQMGHIIDLVEETVSLDDLATGPSRAIPIGHFSNNSGIIDRVTQELRRFPGMGWRIVKTALLCAAIRNRNMAIGALEEWGPDHWPHDAKKMLQLTLSNEPDAKVAKRLQALLKSAQSLR